MVESIRELVKNKRIVFVGNSVEIMKHKLADKINLTVIDTDGDLTTILIPVGSLLLPEPNEATTE